MNLPTESENPTGLHQRYIVTKADGSQTDPRAVYFVLRVDPFGDDHRHISACRVALERYAEEIDGYLPELARDIRGLLESYRG